MTKKEIATQLLARLEEISDLAKGWSTELPLEEVPRDMARTTEFVMLRDLRRECQNFAIKLDILLSYIEKGYL
jgi:hypothetical protein